MLLIAASMACSHAQLQRLPGDGIPVNKPDAQGMTKTWSKLPPDELVKALADAGNHGPEHAILQPLVGNWTYTARFWMDPSKPPLES